MQRIVLERNDEFGRLRIIEFAGVNDLGKSTYRCRCTCKEKRIIVAVVSDLKSGHTASCGCLFREKRAAGSRTTHGKSLTPEHIAWKNMRARCKRDPDYAGRGIKICEGWNSFQNFFKDMGVKNAVGHDLSVDRINNDGNYSCGHCDECLQNNWVANCKWSTPHEQKINQRPRRWHKKPKEEAA